MNIADLQAALNARGYKPVLKTDGVPGRKTMAAVDAVLAADKDVLGAWDDWADARRLIALEQIVYRDAGIEVGAIDGLVGEQTRYARSVFIARAKGDTSVETWRDAVKPLAKPPAPASKWPKQSGVSAFFGAINSGQAMLELPFPMRIAWEPEKTVSRFSCHAKVRDPLRRIFTGALERYGHERLKQLRLDLFGGCLNPRKMRGGSAWSMHSWGIAVDVDPDRNQLTWGRDLASLDDPAYDAWWELVEAEGAVSLGRAINRDWMHFQFARL